MTNSRAIWLDWEHDSEHADPGTDSRYGNDLHRYRHEFRTVHCGNPANDFALTAWNIATDLTTEPGFVRIHPRVLSVVLTPSDWNGEILAEVALISGRPAVLADLTTADRNHYHDRAPRSVGEGYRDITPEGLSRRPFLLTEAHAVWQLPSGTATPRARAAPGEELHVTALDSLTKLVRELNREIQPIIEKLENTSSRSLTQKRRAPDTTSTPRSVGK